MSFKRGTIYLIIAWTLIPVTYCILNIWLARFFGPEKYGIIGLVLSVLLWFELIINNGIPYAVQKFIPSSEERCFGILRTALKLQLIMVAVLFIISFYTAPLLARIFRNEQLTFYFRIAFLDLLFIGLFHLTASFQNGLRKFGKQAVLYIIWAFCRLGFIFLFVLQSGSITGALLANVAASFLGLIFGIIFLGKVEKQPEYDKKKLIGFALPSVLYFLLLTMMLSIDLWVVKYYLSDKVGGYYVAASMVARVPYFISLGLAAAVLPTISSYLSLGKMEKVKKVIVQTFRFLLILLLPFSFVVSVFSREIIVLLFSSEYEPGGIYLSLLVFGITLMAILLLLTTILNADHRPKLSSIIVLVTVVIDFTLNIILVPLYGAIGGALATTISLTIGFMIALFIVLKRFRVFINIKSLVRICIASFCMILILRYLNAYQINFLIIIPVSIICYGLILFCLKEIRLDELKWRNE